MCLFALRAAHIVRYSHFIAGFLKSKHWNDVAPKTQIGHDIYNSTSTIFWPQVELEADRHHEQKKTNGSLQQNAMHRDIFRRLKYLTCIDIQLTLWPTSQHPDNDTKCYKQAEIKLERKSVDQILTVFPID